MGFQLFRWLKIVLINLLIVASLGVVLRYKILYPLPFINQKHLLHGHSHFAFTGWITQALMVLMVSYLTKQKEDDIYKRYTWLLYANLICAYGMLIAFPIEGYGTFSIFFSTAAIIVSYLFAFYYWRDMHRLPFKSIANTWFKAAVFFNAFSSLGAFALTFMMVKHVVHQNWYLAAEYFYLHFQYNGWFFFGCMGLFTAFISRNTKTEQILRQVFRLFAFAVTPAYFLSALWMPVPTWVYMLVILAAIAQVAGWLWLVKLLKNNWNLLQPGLSNVSKHILFCAAVALTAKLLLQLGSTIPSLSNLAFGFRPIVIGYLHLVLLGVITLFLLGCMFAEDYFYLNRWAVRGVFIFLIAVIINEILLMVQGVAAITYTAIPYINEMLLMASFFLFSGAFLFSATKKKCLQK